MQNFVLNTNNTCTIAISGKVSMQVQEVSLEVEEEPLNKITIHRHDEVAEFFQWLKEKCSRTVKPNFGKVSFCDSGSGEASLITNTSSGSDRMFCSLLLPFARIEEERKVTVLVPSAVSSYVTEALKEAFSSWKEESRFMKAVEANVKQIRIY